MRFRMHVKLWAGFALIVLCNHPANALILRSNDFSVDPQWTGSNNTTSPNNFGYSAGTTNATGILANAGEVGGTTARNSFDSFYADTDLTETLTLNHELFGSGSFIIQNPSAWDHTVWIGHFGTSAVDDFIALTISEPSGAFTQSRVRAEIQRDFLGSNFIAQTPQLNVTRGVPHTFSYFWDPDGGTTGRGLLSLTLDSVTMTSEDPGGSFSLSERNIASPGGIAPIGFNGWGISIPGLNTAASTVEVFLDNVVYSIPEPSSAVLLGLAAVVLARRR